MASKRCLTPVAIALALALPSLGCGVIAQAVIGWDSEDTVRQQKTHSVVVQSAPPGAEIVRQGLGEDAAIGAAPLTDTFEYEVEEVVAEAGWLPMLVTGCVELLVGSGIAVASDPIDEDTEETNPVVAFAGAVLIAGLVDTIWGGVRSMDSKTIVSTTNLGPTAVTYLGSKASLPTATFVVQVPSTTRADLVLDPQFVVQTPPPPPPPPAVVSTVVPPPPPPPRSSSVASTETKSWILAVMDVEDMNASDRARRVDKTLVRNLGDQLRIFVAQTGVRTIDRSSQQKALDQQLKTIKSESYQQCYDDSCQIELGKALAASHILRARITKFGKRCVMNGELIDLRAEVTVKAASAQGACEAEGFLTMCERVARDLVR